MDGSAAKNLAEQKYESEFERLIKEQVIRFGGFVNAHAHVDRGNTLAAKYLAHRGLDPIKASNYPLRVKQNLTDSLHRGPAYEKEDLQERMRAQLETMHTLGTRKCASFVDTTADNVKISALEAALEVKKEMAGRIDFRVAAYCLFGFKDSEPERWNVFAEGAKQADFLGTLPERDEAPGHIGYEQQLIRTMKLALELKKPLHVHVDQTNTPAEKGTETLIQAAKWFEIEYGEVPEISAVHAISPSCYDEERFGRVLDGLKRYKINVVCCPVAAISMRQMRQFQSPIHNSIARVLDMLERGIPVSIGTDNIADVYDPPGTPDLYKEVWLLSNATRFYNPEILAKLATETPLNDMDREIVRNVLDQDREAWGWKFSDAQRGNSSSV